MKFSPLAALTALLASPGTPRFAAAQTSCNPKPIPIRDIKFSDIGGGEIHNFELRGNARIVEPAPDGIPRALRIDQLFSYALLNEIDISPSKMKDATMAIGVYIESIRPAIANAPNPNQNESYGWVMSHDNGGYDRAIFLHDERFNGVGMSAGYIPDADPLELPLQEWVQVVAVWRQGGECALYIQNEKVHFTEAVIGKNNNGLPAVAIGAPQLRRYGKENDNDLWIKDVKIFDFALSDQEVEDLNCNFVETLEPTIDCGQGGAPTYSCTECVAADGSASGCGGDCVWRPDLQNCVEKEEEEPVVDCGTHDAADCSQCDVLSADGPSGCAGECKFVEGSCRPFDWEPPVDCGTHEAASCGECPDGEGASGCSGDCMWDPILGECTEDDGSEEVSCGTHDAADCSQCDVSADGSSGCTGECKFVEGSCRPFDWEPPKPAPPKPSGVDCGNGIRKPSCKQCALQMMGQVMAVGCMGDCMWIKSTKTCVPDFGRNQVNCGNHHAETCHKCDLPYSCTADCKTHGVSCLPLDWEKPKPAPKPAPRPIPKPAPRPTPQPAPRPTPKPATVNCGYGKQAGSCTQCVLGGKPSGCSGQCIWSDSVKQCKPTPPGSSVFQCGDHQAANCDECAAGPKLRLSGDYYSSNFVAYFRGVTPFDVDTYEEIVTVVNSNNALGDISMKRWRGHKFHLLTEKHKFNVHYAGGLAHFLQRALDKQSPAMRNRWCPKIHSAYYGEVHVDGSGYRSGSKWIAKKKVAMPVGVIVLSEDEFYITCEHYKIDMHFTRATEAQKRRVRSLGTEYNVGNPL